VIGLAPRESNYDSAPPKYFFDGGLQGAEQQCSGPRKDVCRATNSGTTSVLRTANASIQYFHTPHRPAFPQHGAEAGVQTQAIDICKARKSDAKPALSSALRLAPQYPSPRTELRSASWLADMTACICSSDHVHCRLRGNSLSVGTVRLAGPLYLSKPQRRNISAPRVKSLQIWRPEGGAVHSQLGGIAVSRSGTTGDSKAIRKPRSSSQVLTLVDEKRHSRSVEIQTYGEPGEVPLPQMLDLYTVMNP